MKNNDIFKSKYINNPILCARVYDDGFFAKCILFNDHIISLEETFDHNGGLSKFYAYAIGFNSYQYRELNYSEINYLINNCKIPESIDIKLKKQYGIDVREIIRNSSLSMIRKQKIEKIQLNESR